MGNITSMTKEISYNNLISRNTSTCLVITAKGYF